MAFKSETFSSQGHPVNADVFLPATPGTHPAVLMLHGTFGLLPEYRDDIMAFGDALAANGIAVVLPHYLDATKTPPGRAVLGVMVADLPIWSAVCSDALTHIAADQRYDAAHLGLLGFSLGGHLALNVAMAPPRGVTIRGVVDFFGPTVTAPLPNKWSVLPPVLIVHGTADPLVRIEESEYAVAQLAAAGKVEGRDYVFDRYKDQGHGFKGAALTQARESTVKFLKRVL